ncbi:hypothetical protein AB6809_29850 [Paraburkholderia sp. RCC_158]|uniref:cobaltochelatase CobT-related protein n=1 Tax=Paraburkholderia sp. RCC_158 TaxID=3239220 RepID=UPI0035260CF2
MKVNNRVLILREAITRIIPMLTKRSVKVTQQGTQAYVSYKRKTLEIERVNLPYIPDDADDTLLDATQGFLDHEVGHILFTDQKVVLKAEKKGVHSLHNMIEDTFVERRMGEQFPGCGANLSKMHGFFLTEYIDSQLKEKPEHSAAILMVVAIRAWAGQTAFVDYMHDKWELMKEVTDRLGKDFPKMIRDVSSSEQGLAVAVEAKKRLTPKAPPAPPSPPEPPAAGGEPGEPEEEPASAPSAGEPGDPPEDEGDMPTPSDMPSLGDSPEPPEPTGEDLREPEDDGEAEPEQESSTEPEAEPAGAGDDEDEEDAEAPSGAGAGGESSDEDSGDDEGGDKSDASGDEPGDGMPGGASAQGDDDEEGDQDGGQGEPGDADDDGASGEGSQPGDGEPGEGDGSLAGGEPERDLFKELEEAPIKEFDEAAAEALSKKVLSATQGSEYSIFTRDEDKIFVLEPPEGFDQSRVTEMQKDVDHMIGPLQKDLQRAISARSASVWTGGHKRGKLHGASLARVLTGRDDVFRQKQVNKTKDVAVELVVDMSGSMWNYGKIKVAAYTAYALASVLDSLSIPNEVIGFTTASFSSAVNRAMQDEWNTHGIRYDRTEALLMPILKGFGERVTPEVRRRFALVANDTSLMSENVDGESVQIAHRRLSLQRASRKVLMVLSDGKPACNGLSPTLNKHLKEVVKQIEARGTDVVALGIIDPSVKEFYKNAIVMNDVKDLPTLVMRELHRILVQ